MSRRSSVPRTVFGWAAALMLAACGQEGAGGTPEFVQIPLCSGLNQVLSTNPSGQLICKDVPPGRMVLPKCLPHERLTSDGQTISCVSLPCP